MKVLYLTIGDKPSHLPTAFCNDDRGLEDETKIPPLDVETLLQDPRLFMHGFRGPGLGYRKVARLTVCQEE